MATSFQTQKSDHRLWRVVSGVNTLQNGSRHVKGPEILCQKTVLEIVYSLFEATCTFGKMSGHYSF